MRMAAGVADLARSMAVAMMAVIVGRVVMVSMLVGVLTLGRCRDQPALM